MPTSADLLRAWLEEVWNNGNEDSIDKYLSTDVIVHGMDEAGHPAKGPDGFRPFFRKMRAGFSDIHLDVHRVIDAGAIAAAMDGNAEAHQRHALFCCYGPVVAVTEMGMGKVEGGKFAQAWNEWDRLSMLLAIGALTPAAS